MFLDFSSYFWYLPVVLLGACVGSFLNVVIYRLPLGLSVNQPKRSFCPLCKNPIVWWRNIPILSWLLLRGKCADCHAPIPVRYWIVEVVTALLFAASWYQSSVLTALLLFVFMALAVAIGWIDAEHQIIPISLTWGGSAVALIYAGFHSELLHVRDPSAAHEGPWWTGVKDAGLGWVLGFFGLWSVVLLGKMIFGKKKIAFDVPTDWQLIDAPTDADPVVFSCEGEDIPWDDLFFRKSDELLLECTAIELNGSATGQGLLKIREHEITTPDGTVHRLEDVKSLSGKVTHATIPREAMGMGDPHLLGMIGAFIGGFGVVFTIASSAVFAIIAAVLGRIGLGRPLPYGPFLLLGALAWIFGGWKLWQLYVDWISFR